MDHRNIAPPHEDDIDWTETIVSLMGNIQALQLPGTYMVEFVQSRKK